MVDVIPKPKLPEEYKPYKDLLFTRLHIDDRGPGYAQTLEGHISLSHCLNARASNSPDLVPFCREFQRIANPHAEKTGEKRISLLQLVRKLDTILQEPFSPAPDRN